LEHPAAASAGIHLGWALTINRSHPDYPALLLTSAYLGQHRQFNGTLMQKVRVQRGLNYGTYAYAEHFSQDGDTRFPLPNTARRQQYFSIWLRPVATAHAAFATTLVHHELQQLVKTGVSATEFSELKQFAKRYFSLYLQSQSRRVGFALDDAFYQNDQPFRERLHRAWDALTVDQLNRVIRRHLRPDSVTIGIITNDVQQVRAAFTQTKLQLPHYATKVSKSVRREDKAVLHHSLSLKPSAIAVVSATDLF
jgi:zinc protease